jgi:hypothetical protein
MAQGIYAASAFKLALIGEECSGWSSKDQLRPEEVAKGGYLVSPEIFDRMGLRSATTVTLASGLRWFPWQ